MNSCSTSTRRERERRFGCRSPPENELRSRRTISPDGAQPDSRTVHAGQTPRRDLLDLEIGQVIAAPKWRRLAGIASPSGDSRASTRRCEELGRSSVHLLVRQVLRVLAQHPLLAERVAEPAAALPVELIG